jgi:formylglycine-generating enzyme
MHARPYLLVVFALWAAGPPASAGGEPLKIAGRDRTVLIEAGWFTMGSDADDLRFAASLCSAAENSPGTCSPEQFQDEEPAHRVRLSRYSIDRTEVSREAYRRCVLANVCAPSRVPDTDEGLGRPEYPVTGVTWAEARRYCGWTGGDLPTEAQWERAARGGGRRTFPWGRYYNSHLANLGGAAGGTDAADGFQYAAPVEAFAEGRSQYGLLNTAGNVWELTHDRYAPDYYRKTGRVNPAGPEQGDQRVIRGGSWSSPPYTARVTERDKLAESESRPDVGFRCAYPYSPR